MITPLYYLLIRLSSVAVDLVGLLVSLILHRLLYNSTTGWLSTITDKIFKHPSHCAIAIISFVKFVALFRKLAKLHITSYTAGYSFRRSTCFIPLPSLADYHSAFLNIG